MRRAVTYAVVVVVILGFWWLLSATGSVAPLSLPPPADVAEALPRQGGWLPAIGTTAVRTAAGFGLAAGAEADAVILAVCAGAVAVNAALHTTERHLSRRRDHAA